VLSNSFVDFTRDFRFEAYGTFGFAFIPVRCNSFCVLLFFFLILLEFSGALEGADWAGFCRFGTFDPASYFFETPDASLFSAHPSPTCHPPRVFFQADPEGKTSRKIPPSAFFLLAFARPNPLVSLARWPRFFVPKPFFPFGVL